MFKRLLVIILALLIGAGCQSGENPLTPIDLNDTPSPGITRTSDMAAGNRVLWGLFEWVIDLENETFEAIPLRSSDMHLNVSKFIDMAPSKFSFTNFAVDKIESAIALDVGITHPFPTKANLAGFDVRGILIGSGSVSNFDDPSILAASNTEVHLVNPDGFTRWWNPAEFQHADTLFGYRDGSFGIPYSTGNYNCTLNAYKQFSDDLGKNEHTDGLNISDRGVFSNGSTNTRHYIIYFPQQDDKFVIRFNYAVDASWEAIPGYIPGESVNIPDDYTMDANMSEAFRIDTTKSFNSLYYEDDSVKGGSLVYEVKVFDWQGYLDDSDVADQITEVKIESPDCFTGAFYGTLTDPGSGNLAYATYEVTIEGSALITSGSGNALITVTSSYDDYQDDLTGYTGTAPLAGYEFFPFATISPTAPPPNEKPTADAVADKNAVLIDEIVTFDASVSSDDDGIIISYEWDFDGDGTYGDSYFAGTDIYPQIKWSEPGNYNVNLRVTDDDFDTDTLNVPITIQVSSETNDPPFAIASTDTAEINPGDAVTFDATGSYDPDGTIVTYEWDFDDDGVYGDSYDLGIDQAPVVYFNELGSFDIDLKVTDDEDATDTLDEVITIYVVSPENDPPTAVAELISEQLWADNNIEFDGSGSWDPDGTIAEWLWDFDNDGIYGDPIDGGTPSNPLRKFTEGLQTVDLKVIDNGGKSDILDEPITFEVQGHVVITLEEDQYYKSGAGYEYHALSCATPDLIGVDYFNYSGHWDFTTQLYDEIDNMLVFDPSDSEVSVYNPGFPASIEYYTRYDIYAENISGYIYMPEEADYANNLLWVYGHIEKTPEMSSGAVIDYSAAENGPISLTYPWSVNTDEHWYLQFETGTITFIEIIYSEVGIGEGEVTVPFDGVWTTDALLTRTTMEYKLGGISVVRTLMYKWTADDGRQVARLFSINTNSETNFNEITYEITGISRLEALKAAL